MNQYMNINIVVTTLYKCLCAYMGVCISALRALTGPTGADQPPRGVSLTPPAHGLRSCT